MSKLNALAGGYKGGSPRVRSENSLKPFAQPQIKVIDAQELANTIKGWYSEDKLSLEGVQIIINELQKLS